MDKDSPQQETYSAPYGRACMNCSQSKCKCIYPKAGGRCQICQRLNKDCRQPPFQKRQNTRKSHSSRTTRLEEKLEDLVSLLRAGVQPSSGNITTALLGQSQVSRDIQLNSAVSPPDSLDASFDNSAHNVYHPLPNAAVISPDTSASDGSGHTLASSLDSLEPTVLQAEEYLTSFHTRMLPYFPCVYIPPGITAEQLQRERPFLWICIMAVASRIDITAGTM